jgi:putative ABC transport system permease protein
VLQLREESQDVKVIPWLESLRSDTVVGWRRLNQFKVTSAAAILSLALAIGACTATFRLVDALLLRPLPVTGADRLYAVVFQGIMATDGKAAVYDSSSYPMFQEMRDASKGDAEAFAVSYAERTDLTYASDQETETSQRQFVSGTMFTVFGIQAALGRVLSSDDDRTPGAHPVAVLSHDYWARRFGADPKVLGKTFRMGDTLFEIVGVAGQGFTGTETGTMTDIFLPTMMANPGKLKSSDNFWLRTLLVANPGVNPEPLRQKLAAVFRAIQLERAKGWTSIPKQQLDQYLQQEMLLEPAASGRSNLQRDYGQPLTALGLLVALVLLIACTNVANLMTARAAARSREMALRVSIGAGRGRLVQLVLLESALLALLATTAGAIFAWWSAPLIVRMINSADNTTRLDLPADWRVLAFALTLTLSVTMLFGLPSALRASAVKPASSIKGGVDPHSRKRLMHVLIAVQVTFCLLVLFAAGLFVATFDRLSHQPLGYSPDRIVNLESLTPTPQSPVYWDQAADRLRTVPGVEAVAMSGWPLMSGESTISNVSTNGMPPTDVFADVMFVSPDWFAALRIPLLDGRDFRLNDTNPGVAIVNQAFAKQYFDGANPVGKVFERVDSKGGRVRVEIAGYIPDVRYRDRMRLPIRPTFYYPLRRINGAGELQPVGRATFVVRTSSPDPSGLANVLRQTISGAHPGFRVSNIRTQNEIIESKTVRERMLAMLALFFAVVAVLLAGVGLYGVLDYSVLQQRREFGIRMAIGAASVDIARRVTAEALVPILAGVVAGFAIGAAAIRYVEPMLYQVRGSDFSAMALPCLTIVAVAFVATVPAVIRAVHIDPITMLRME